MTDEQIKTLEKERAFLYEVAQTVHSLELAEVLQEIVRIAEAVTQGDSVLIYLLDPKTETLVLRASKNPHTDLLTKITLKVGEGITGWVAAEKKPVALPRGARRDPRFKVFRSLPEDTFEAFLSVPILIKKEVVGVINVQHKQVHDHTPMEVNLLAAMGKLVGGVVENARLVEETMSLKEALALRKLVEKAKGILMKKKGLSEENAFRLLQKESMNSGKTLREVADAVVFAEKLAL